MSSFERTADGQRLIDMLPVPAFALDCEYRLVAFSLSFAEAMRQFYGVDPEVGANFLDSLAVAADRSFAKSVIDSALSGQTPNNTLWLGTDATRRFFVYQVSPARVGAEIDGVLVVAIDMTEQALAEVELARLEAVVNSSEHGIVGLTLDGRIEAWNATAERLTGYTAREAIGQSWSVLSRSGSADEDADLMEHVVQGRRLESLETVKRRKDGSEFDVALTLLPVTDSSGALTGASVIVRDMTERRRAEELLRASENRFQALFETATDAIIIFDTQTRCVVEVNSAAREMYGYSLDEFRALNVSDLSADDREAWDVVGRGKRSTQLRFHKRKDGGALPVEIAISQLEDGDTALAMGVVRDVSERMALEKALRSSATKFRTIADFTYNWEWWAAPDGSYVYVSPSSEVVTGYCPDEFMADPDLLMRILHDDDRAAMVEHMTNLRATGCEDFEFRIVARDGSVRWIEHECQPAFAEDGEWLGRRASNRDITDRKRAEMSLERELDIARSMAEVSGALVAETLSIDDVSRLILDCARQLTGAQYAFVSVIDVATGDEVASMLEETMPSTRRLAPDELRLVRVPEGMGGTYPGLVGEALNTHQGFFKNTPEPPGNVLETPAGRIELRNFAAVPALSGERLVGQVALANSPDGFSDQDLGILARLTGLYAVAVMRRETEKALEEAQSYLQAALDNSQAGIAIRDAFTGRLRYINRAALLLGGNEALPAVGDRDELTLGSWHLLNPDGTTTEAEEMPTARAMRLRAPQSNEFVIRRERLADRVVLANAAPICDADGNVIAGIVVFFDISERLEAEVELERSHAQLERMVYQVTEAMGRVVEVRDPYTAGHQQGVARLSRAIAVEMGMSEDEVEGIELAALVHDIGKLSVPSEILAKPGRLTDLELNMIREHSQSGFDILKDIAFPWPVAELTLQHQERLDGSGYPRGLVGDEILMSARILAVADVIEAMASHRPYRAALGLDVALAEVASHPEKYDAAVVETCLKLHREGRLRL